MSEGIIQEVMHLHKINECKCVSACHDLSRIQQDLIEKIRQDFKDYDIDIVRMLIGDTK